MVDITDKMKMCFELGNNVAASGECEYISVVDVFTVNTEQFYMIRYEGKFERRGGVTLAYLYACFFDGCTTAEPFESELGAMIDAVSRYQKQTGNEVETDPCQLLTGSCP